MKVVGWVMALALIATSAACGPRRTQPMTAFDGRIADWTQQILTDSPETATQAGVSEEAAGGRYKDRLDDRSMQAVDARRSAALRRYAELRALDTRQLSAADTLTLSVLREQFEAGAAAASFEYGDFTPLGGLRPYVLNQMDSAFLTLPIFLDERHNIANADDAEAYLTRLRAVADAIDAETARARADAGAGVHPPLFIMDATLQALQSVLQHPAVQQIYVTGLQRKLDALAASINDPAERAAQVQRNLGYVARAEAIVRDHVLPAHQRAALFIISDRTNATDAAGVSTQPHGAEFYAAALRIETTTTLTPDEIHRIGLARVQSLTNELDIALRRVGLTEGTVGARLSQMTADPRYAYPETDEGRAQLMADVRTRIDRVMQLAPQWFGRMPRARLDVRAVPPLLEAGQPGAYYEPASLEGDTPGIYYINLRDLSEMTKIDLPTQDYHEAAPGHHFQTSLAQEDRSAPLLRRLMSFNAYSEGWGLYAEQFADEQGFYDGDPVGRIGYLRWQLWRAARLVVDTGLHAQGWTRQRAIDYMIATTGDAPGVVVTEIDRYIVWPGQACGYELGRREIVRLRDQARNALGPDFDLRGFHDTVLLNGEVPLSVLDRLVRDWIPEQRRAAERERQRR